MTEKFIINQQNATITYFQNDIQKFTKPMNEVVSTYGDIETFKNWAVTNGISVEVAR